MLTDPKTIILAIAFGILPSLVWLFFWLKEDKKKPEPKGRIFATFLAGMIAVFAVIPIERFILGNVFHATLSSISLGVIVSWAFAEEFFKYIAAYVSSLRSKADDEPIDPLIYMITAALGFAAMENALFVFGPLQDGLFLQSFITGNMRLVGATLLHVASSGTIGAALSLSFYRKKSIRRTYFLTGLMLSVLLHALFNFLIIKSVDMGVFAVFFGVWLVIVAIILMFEKIKNIKRLVD